jgi:hypothetical protein
MTLNKKFTAFAAVLAIAALSIYATTLNFMTTNKTVQTVNVTLNTLQGAQIPVVVAPGQSMPTPINDDQVTSMTIYGCTIPAGVNAIVGNPSGGTVTIYWSMGGGSCNGIEIDPGTIS